MNKEQLTCCNGH